MIMMKTINYLLQKLGLRVVKVPVPVTDELRIKLYAEHISNHSPKGELGSSWFVGEVNWDTWQSRINDKILEKELKSDKEHLGD
jgi:hypothetical protein